jgi:Ca2+/Na+ antiporter
MLNIVVPVTATVAVVYCGMTGMTELAFWLAVAFFAVSVSLLWYSVRDPLRDDSSDAFNTFKDAIDRANIGLAMVMVLSGVWAVAAVLPRPLNSAHGVPQGPMRAEAGRLRKTWVAAVIAFIGFVALIPVGAYVVMEFASR